MSQAEDLASPLVLVVDDEPELRSLLAEYFSRHGYSVRTAGDAAQARTALEASLANNPFDPELHCALANTYASLANTDAALATKRDRARRACDQR